MGKVKDITGQKFGRLTVIKFLRIEKHKAIWLCKCECGNLTGVTISCLTNGNTKSCGCLRKERNIESHKTHGQSRSRLYYIWNHMKSRCYNKNHKDYKNYGGRGIKICDEWQDNFQAFYDWSMSHGYDDTLTIDRIDNNGNYEPNNCRWVTVKQQNRNRRSNINFTCNGETHCLMDWCKILGLNYNTVYNRFHNCNWSIEKALDIVTTK